MNRVSACDMVPSGDADPSLNAFASALSFRPADLADLDVIVSLENVSFAAHRASSRASIRNSLLSTKQWVVVAEICTDEGDRLPPVAAAIVILYRKSLRIYSIAVGRLYRGLGIGDALLEHLVAVAARHGFRTMILEADAENTALVDWYRKHGFAVVQRLEGYYGPGEAAVKMSRSIAVDAGADERIILVLDDGSVRLDGITDLAVFSARDYLSEARFSISSHYHVLNFCNSFRTHSLGYYVSLLASARNHRVTPTVMTVKDSSNLAIAQSLLDEARDFLSLRLKGVKEDRFEITVIMGRSVTASDSDIARKLFSLFELPFFTLTLERNNGWRVRKMNLLTIRQVVEQCPDVLGEALDAYRLRKRYKRTRLRNYKYDLAILVNENEAMPPSCSAALKQFRQAAEEVGFFVEFVTRGDRRRICEFDALFIRETTALDNHTYAMARHAYTEGLVVIDDPWSILLCSNKVYLHERLANAGIRQPRGWLLTRGNCSVSFAASLPYPLVLKLPESSFSLGVHRVDNIDEFQAVSRKLFAESDLVIAQEFLPSAYDWRIGVMDNSPLFACKYHMADDHWQIYNWASPEPNRISGAHETVPIELVPPQILKAAMKASALIGDGLYGVDLKEIGPKACVIEINDNPNIDAGVEDAQAGSELYLKIMHSFINRIEVNRHQVRYLS